MSKNSELLLGSAKHRISSTFGYRIHPITHEPQGHNGTDYATYNQNVPCYAPADGNVLRVSMDQYGGKFCYVGFPELNRVGLYYHLDQITVKVNKTVNKGDQIGIVGTTGRSTGIHLHFSWIEWNDEALSYYQADYEDFEKYEFPREKEDEEEMAERAYKTLDEVPAWGKKTVEKIIKKGGITPTENSTATISDDEINLTHSMLRIYVSMDKMGMLK